MPIDIDVASLRTDFATVPADRRILAAVSGGADSMALLWLLHQSGRDIVAGHVNHGLRGQESDADAEFVAAHCREIGVQCRVATVNDPPLPLDANEAQARDVRYKLLQEMAQAENCGIVATGHTADDQLETVLINWLRGAAVTGLTGMRAERNLGPEVTLVRPLLSITRERTRELCRQAGWQWREDASNCDPKYLRNRIRNELVPLLCSLRGGQYALAQLLNQNRVACDILHEDLTCLDEIAAWQLEEITVKADAGLIVLRGPRFAKLPVALQRRVLRLGAIGLDRNLTELSYAKIEATRRHIQENAKRCVWQWSRHLNVEWTGPMAGERIRLWLVS